MLYELRLELRGRNFFTGQRSPAALCGAGQVLLVEFMKLRCTESFRRCI